MVYGPGWPDLNPNSCKFDNGLGTAGDKRRIFSSYLFSIKSVAP